MRGKRGGFSPGAAARHRIRTRVLSGFLLFFTFSAVVECFFRCFLLLCEIGRLLDPKSEIGKSFASKAESSGEDPRATGGLVFNLSHSWVNKTKQHTRVPRNLRPRAHFSHFGVTNSPP